MSKKPPLTWTTPVLCVHDMTQTLEHYETVLGFDILWTWSPKEAFETPKSPSFCCVGRGECSLFLCEQGQGQPGSWTCLNLGSVADLEALHQEYQESGANILEAPLDRSWGMCEMVVQDLDGNVFRFGASIAEADCA